MSERRKITIELLDPIKGHNGLISQVVLREPSLRDLFDLGEPQILGFGGTGKGIAGQIPFLVEDNKAIGAYFERLVQPPADPLLLGNCSLRDAMKIKAAIVGFFTEARVPSDSSKPDSSSST
ncbi:MAG: hypothetical protein ABSC37_07750 [Xanthobacteraceae bacterium]|jgi:hypothetical protein